MPWFLTHLALADDADERAIKRAYARQLKQIDQEADAAAFQKLREAYEASVHWAAWQRHRREEEARETEVKQSPQVDAGPEPSPAAAQASGEGVDQDDAATASIEPIEPIEPIAPAAPTPQALAASLFDEHFGSACTSEDDARARLERCLDDPRLIDLEARLIFEWRVAHALAEGYREGHDFLWTSAQAAFGWDDDHTRLRQFNRVGHVLENAINEQDFFERQDDARRFEQARILQRLRGDQQPADNEFARLMPVLEWMLATYPNWMWVTAKAENVRGWRERHQKLPLSLKAIRQPAPTSEPAGTPAPPAQRESSSRGGYFVFMLCFMGLVSFFRILGSGHDDPQPYRFDPTRQPQVQADMDRITRAIQAASASAPAQTQTQTVPPNLGSPDPLLGGKPLFEDRPSGLYEPAREHAVPTGPATIVTLKRDAERRAADPSRMLNEARQVVEAPARPRQVPAANPDLRSIGDPGHLEMPQLVPTGIPSFDTQPERNKLDGQIKSENVKLGGTGS